MIKKILPAAIFLLLVFFLKDAVARYPGVIYQGQMARANRLLPNLQYLIELPGNINPDHFHLLRFTKYYEFIISFDAEQSGAYDLLGLCYNQMGLTDKAMTTYQKSIALNPDFFWSHYNLGMMYFKEGRFESSAKEFEKALNTPGEKTLIGLLSSVCSMIL